MGLVIVGGRCCSPLQNNAGPHSTQLGCGKTCVSGCEGAEANLPSSISPLSPGSSISEGGMGIGTRWVAFGHRWLTFRYERIKGCGTNRFEKLSILGILSKSKT